MVKNLRFRRKKVKFWQKVLLIYHSILKTEGDPNTHDNAYYQSKSWKFLTKIDENQRKMTKNDEKWRKKGKKWLFFKFFRDLNAKIPKNTRSRERLLPRSRIFIQQVGGCNFFSFPIKCRDKKLMITSTVIGRPVETNDN